MFLSRTLKSLALTGLLSIIHLPVQSQNLILQRKNEPKEGAFSLLVPKNWNMEGGIFRIDPTAGSRTLGK